MKAFLKRNLERLFFLAFGSFILGPMTLIAQDWYEASGAPTARSLLNSATLRTEFAAIETGIADKLPVLTGNGGQIVVVNSGGTALEASGSTIAGISLSPSANETVTGLWTFEAQVDLDNGSALRLYDSTDTDYVNEVHDGTDAIRTFATTADWRIDGSGLTSGVHFTDGSTDKVEIDYANTRVDIHDGWHLIIRNSGDTDYGDFYHDGTDFNFDFTNTTDVDFDVDGARAIVIDDTTCSDCSRLQVWDVDDAQMKRVYIGSTSSCGSGYRCLRVVN